MKYQGVMLVCEDIERVKQFYHDILGLRVTMDLGVNITMTGGISFQTKDSWSTFTSIENEAFQFGGLDKELYFEEVEFDAFVEKLKGFPVTMINDVLEARWGQRCVRFLDPDQHMIEVGEDLKSVAKRFELQGMDEEAVAKRMEIPLKLAKHLLK